MGFLVSPGVQVNEVDLTNVVPAVATSIGAIAGAFQKGPVSSIVNISSEEELVEILVDANAMESYGLNPTTVISLVSSNNQLVTAGAMEQSGGRLVLKVPAVIESLDELINMPIKVADNTTLKFGDVASIRRVFSDANGWSRVDGEASVVLEVKKRIGSNLLEVVEETKTTINIFTTRSSF